MKLLRCSLLLFFILFSCRPLSAENTDGAGEFFVGFAGSAVFPYDPKNPSDAGGAGIDFNAGAGFSAAFGYSFKEGFSTEMEWGYQKAAVGAPSVNLSQGFNTGSTGSEASGRIPISIRIDGDIKTQSLMGNVYYRYPKWKVSPYAGFGLGSFFHNGVINSSVTLETALPDFLSGLLDIPAPDSGNTSDPHSLMTTVAYDDTRFAYQIMAGLSARLSRRMEFRFGYRFRSSRGQPIDSDQIEGGVRFHL
ncbi:MAG: outer membrane beta-barrel protein [Bryobacterales bacterium]|nr:outer membrane beta-barrel protein [Bryobacterales bacterium]MDE0293689.1 outer membrane beta-barrel protein [Bryobacterales bacterium]MDE0434125.1 outer membrane beta-barrel protein [Bryobacterales bacterium]